MNLWESFLTNQDRIIYKWTHYFPVYERHLQKFRNQSIVLIEIGCGKGGSLQLWKKYLGPFAKIVGIDIDPVCKDYEEDNISIRIGDQSDAAFLKSVVEEFGNPDVVIDDGSHIMSHLRKSFDFLYPLVDKNGVYIVEDLHTCYWEEYEGGYLKSDSFFEFGKKLIDELNADHTRGKVEKTKFSESTLSMCFYDSMIVFEKGIHLKKHAPQFGKN